MLSINKIYAQVSDQKEILKGLNLEVRPGEVHAIMGPNGAGKSTLSNVLAGRDGYEVTGGDILFNDKNLLEMSAEERACAGIFLAFQYPVEIPGVNNAYFLRTALNSVRRAGGQAELDSMSFMALAREKMKLLQMDPKFLKRAVNEGFSGGEKKRNEILQMLLLDPELIILDETDSGLDIDALKIVAGGVNYMRGKDKAIVMITHYQRLLDYIIPDYVHVLADGKIIKSGDKTLALELEEKGYGWLNVEGKA
ncbi:Fe-S cluster assembly ATPase SufC [Piscirickettsia salmonis]|uniref:ATP-dependent transporter SufC n=1 Tax=Piscirickettsia salmonis TaxID=1238 RepID=A0A9Q5VJV7_PISSA|nr:Fe-S cluster assembly ATPase SufC [Piscirickettsia salmonis]ALA24906.1 Fe-S cluster assembly ATPase SufC [Piscirickettsia salmonis]APS45215.1 Fe-S cluster assembly ATPase SufC [Piscirickettsia salmonis]APS48576.1 Fe-S cluster assembly ATPase SufC [Piscirickettsia salmonis]APS49835.1 Fe-S cluster assembly ATPase SufC [Piscirickettsia salmonis]APS53021.1 Fe-S cluster assembly ATPase SufC [Piscirickettsia salmonis]